MSSAARNWPTLCQSSGQYSRSAFLGVKYINPIFFTSADGRFAASAARATARSGNLGSGLVGMGYTICEIAIAAVRVFTSVMGPVLPGQVPKDGGCSGWRLFCPSFGFFLESQNHKSLT